MTTDAGATASGEFRQWLAAVRLTFAEGG